MGRNFLLIVIVIACVILGFDIIKTPSPSVEKSRGAVEDITSEDFSWGEVDEDVEQEVIQEKVSVSKPVLIYFYTTWCGSCRQFSPYWDKIVKEYGDKYTCLKINIDEPKYKKIAREFNINGIPQVYIYDKEKKKKTRLKVTTYMNPELDQYYDKYLKK